MDWVLLLCVCVIADSLVEITIDGSRNILYTRSTSGIIQVVCMLEWIFVKTILVVIVIYCQSV